VATAIARGIQFSDYLALIASRLRDFRIADCSRVRTLFPLGCVIGRSSTYIVDKRLAEALSVAWYWATLFPLNCNSLLNGLATMGYPDSLQIVAVCSLEGWDDCHTLPNLRHSKQAVRCKTLEQNIWLDVCEAASCIDHPWDGIPRVQQQQRIRGKAADIYETRLAALDRCGAGSQGLSWR
jgi:hypothetical protein